MNTEYPIEIEYDELKCPLCREGYLHQTKVHIFNPKEEGSKDQSILSIENTGGDVNFDNQFAEHPIPPKNPSPYRQGVSIDFYCEYCPVPSRLHIYQHKGNTQIKWESEKDLL